MMEDAALGVGLKVGLPENEIPIKDRAGLKTVSIFAPDANDQSSGSAWPVGQIIKMHESVQVVVYRATWVEEEQLESLVSAWSSVALTAEPECKVALWRDD